MGIPDGMYDLSMVNFLSGMNRTGKTSFLQAIWLAHQSDASGIKLDNFDAGDFGGLVNVDVDENWVSLDVIDGSDRIVTYRLSKDESESQILNGKYGYVGRSWSAGTFGQKLLNQVFWVRADRSTKIVRDLGNIDPNVMLEAVDVFLELFGEIQFGSKLVSRVKETVNEWHNSTENVLRVNGERLSSGHYYALPIVLGGMLASAGDVLLIENPELHLHPHVQAQMAKWLSVLASKGVQVIVESHSETFLNNFRIAAISSEVGITSSDLNVFHFMKPKDVKQIQIIRIPVEDDEHASINRWPFGFFDQNDNDLQQIFGI